MCPIIADVLHLDIRTREFSIYVIATRFSPDPRQTNIHFHSFLLSYGYLVAFGLVLLDSRPRIAPRLVLLAIACLTLFAAHVAGLYVAGTFVRAWLEGSKTSEDIYGPITTLTLAWALVPAAVWFLGYLHTSLSPGSSARRDHAPRPRPRRTTSR